MSSAARQARDGTTTINRVATVNAADGTTSSTPPAIRMHVTTSHSPDEEALLTFVAEFVPFFEGTWRRQLELGIQDP